MKRPILETRLFKTLLPYRKKRFLVAVSGGRDSIALLALLKTISQPLELKLGVAHIHHGVSDDSLVNQSRSHAREFTRDIAKKFGFEFYTAENEKPALKQSEATWRKFRHEALENLRKLNQFDFIVYGHHQDDLLETRLIRLLRGTGSAGLKAMNLSSGSRLRPLLDCSAKEIDDYAKALGLSWYEDPSNKDVSYFRNWIRHHWLPQLEQYRSGTTASLARSLELLTQDLKPSTVALSQVVHPAGGLDRKKFADLSKDEKKNILSSYLRTMPDQDFDSAQINEVIKRLNTVQKNLTFPLARLRWSVNAQRISAEL